jgi:hypothetical protein
MKDIENNLKWNKHIVIAGIRQMDDLALWIKYKGKKGLKLAKQAKHNILKEVYGDGLIVEEEKGAIKIQGDTFEHTFSGTTITGNVKGGALIMTAYNKNKESLQTTGKQKYRRFPPFESYTNITYKQSTAIGNFTRVSEQHTRREDVPESIYWEIIELQSIDYPNKMIGAALWKVRQDKLSKEEKSTITRRMRWTRGQTG